MASPATPRARYLRAALLTFAIGCVSVPLSPCPARGERGQWTPLFDLGGEAIHIPPTPFSQRRSVGESLPERHSLYPNEPNPTGTLALIRFDLPQDSPVRLEVFDLTGRHVATLAEGFPRASTPACGTCDI